MRLDRVAHGHGWAQRTAFKAMKLVFGVEPYDIIKLLTYRADFFGSHMNRITQAVLRGPSEWSVGERELFAAFVSLVNQCPF